MKDEARDSENSKAVGNNEGQPPTIQNTELPTHKAGRPIAIGFVLGALYFSFAFVSGTFAEISLVQLLIQMTGLVGICILATMCSKGWMGERWSNQHKFEKSLRLLVDVSQGIALFVMAFGVISFIFFGRY